MIRPIRREESAHLAPRIVDVSTSLPIGDLVKCVPHRSQPALIPAGIDFGITPTQPSISMMMSHNQ